MRNLRTRTGGAAFRLDAPLEFPSDLPHLAPEPVSNPRHRSSEFLRNFLPVVAGTSERQDRPVPLAQFANEVLQLQLRIYLPDPAMVHHETGQLNCSTRELKATGLGHESPKRPREGQQEQSVLRG